MLTAAWEIIEEKTDWRGITLAKARQTGAEALFLLEDFSLVAPGKERVSWEIAANLEKCLAQAREIKHPALRMPVDVTRHLERYFLVRGFEQALWDSWGPEPKHRDLAELGRWLGTMAEILEVYHQAGLATHGLAKTDLVQTEQGILVLEPLCGAHLAVYRDKESCGRNDLAPEMTHGAAWDKDADLFAFGLNAYQLVTGRFPLSGSGPQLLHNLLKEPIVDPRAFNPALGPAPAAILLALLARKPGQRPDATTLRAALAGPEAAQKWLATEDEREAFVRRGQGHAHRLLWLAGFSAFMRRRRAIFITLMAVLGVAGLFYLLRGRPAAPTITSATSEGQVVAYFYDAIANINMDLLEETLAPGTANWARTSMATLFVSAKTQQSMGDAGPTQNLISVRNLTITPVEGQDSPVYTAQYDLVLHQGLIDQITTYKDRLTLQRSVDKQVGKKWRIEKMTHEELGSEKRSRLHYQVLTPPGYKADEGRKWPLLIYLHDTGENGGDLLKDSSLGRFTASAPGFPCLLLLPDLDPSYPWDLTTDALALTLEDVEAAYTVDTRRIYLTGAGFGGDGTWAWASKSPQLFAAIAPLASAGRSANLDKLKGIPVWAFQGKTDTIASPKDAQRTVDKLKAGGGEVRFTLLPEAGHDLGALVYKQELIDWFLAHKR